MKDISATVIVDLNCSLDQIYDNLQKDARWGIKKAQREGLFVKIIDKKDPMWDKAWEEFYPIYYQTLDKTSIYVESVDHVKRYAVVLILCLKGDQLLAGAALDVINNTPKLTRNGSLKEFQNLQPNNLLYWECIKWSKERGYPTLDLGGWQINPGSQEAGVNSFKERWGRVVYSKKEYPFYRAIGRKVVKRFRWLRPITNRLKKHD